MEGPVLSFLGMVNLPRRFPPPWSGMWCGLEATLTRSLL